MSVSGKPGEPDPAMETAAEDDAVIGRAFKWSVAAIVVVAAVVVVVALVALNWGQGDALVDSGPIVKPTRRETVAAEIPLAQFTDVTDEAGIAFVHENGATGNKLLPETMGSGCAFFDYDNDGDADLLLINSCHWEWTESPPGPPPTMALYRNDGTGKFEDVTVGSGLDATFYGMGVACGDYDNDGWVDAFCTAVGPNRLFHNEQGKFVETTADAGVAGADDSWSTPAAFFDMDNDGDLDLFVGNYVLWSREIDARQGFTLTGGERAYGPPRAFEGSLPYLYRNEGGGKFTDVSESSGVQVRNPNTNVPMAKMMGLAPVDVDGDGLLDLIVSNDTVENFFFHNRGNGEFVQIGKEMGIAFDSAGNARGAMGVDAAWFRNDASLGIVIGNFANEPTALYVSAGGGAPFTDEATASGVGPPSRLELKFGVVFVDYDLDGRQDILCSNGHLEEDIAKVQASQQYAQPPRLFWNAGADQGSEFVSVPPEKCGTELEQRMVGRGSAYADIDLDGDQDVVLTASGGAPRLLRNDQDLGHHWVRLKLRGTSANRDAIGATVEVHAGGQTFKRQVMPTRSYLSQSELAVVVGLGSADKIDKIVVHWPGGAAQELADVPVDRETVVEQE